MECFEAMQQEFKNAGIPFFCGEPLARHTSFRIGGPAGLFCTPRSTGELVRAIGLCRRHAARYYLLGRGSNLLFRDEGFDGVVISTCEMREEITVKQNCITASAGTSLNRICRAAADHSLTGLEFAYGIPGSLGGAVYMNAGAYGGEMRSVLRTVTFLDGEGRILTKPAGQLELGYRTSLFSRTGWCVLKAELCLEPGERETITAKMEQLLNRRREKQPLEYPSAGSTFKRPEGAFAGALIEQSGLRGAQMGGAAVSEKHCGFIVNLGGATCADVLALAERVQQVVKERTGYTLEKEIRVVE